MSEGAADERIDEYTSARDGRLFHTEKHARTSLWVGQDAEQARFRLPAGQGRVLSVSPEGGKIAVVQFRSRDDDGWREDHLISVLDTATGERLWTWGSRASISPLSWSGDGRRIVIQGAVRDASTGELLYPNMPDTTVTPGAGVSIEDRSDADYARYRDD